MVCAACRSSEFPYVRDSVMKLQARGVVDDDLTHKSAYGTFVDVIGALGPLNRPPHSRKAE